MSSKRFNEGGNNFDKNGNATSGARNANGQGQQGSKQRLRATGGTTSAKLSVPRPVHLPSLRKESQEHETSVPVNPTTSGSAGWQRSEERSKLETWSQRVTFPRQGVERTTLNQEEFPTLEAATHISHATPKLKSRKSTASPERSPPKDDEEEEEQPVSRMPWEDDERFGVSQGPMMYGPPTMFMPMGSQGMPADPYLHPYYPRPYYAPSPRTPGQAFRPNYYPPTDGMYHPYVQMYPQPFYPGYGHPEPYTDDNAYSLPTQPSRQVTRPTLEEQSAFALALPKKDTEAAVQPKIEAEHPRTPDKSSGKGTLILTKRQSDDTLQEESRSVLRKMSLPKEHSLALSRPSEELDWEAQVDAEERARERKEIKILTRPSRDSVQSMPVTHEKESEREAPGWRRHDRPVARNERWSHSPMRHDPHKRDTSVDTTGRPVAASSDLGVPFTFPHGRNQNLSRPMTSTPPPDRPRQSSAERLPEGWSDHRAMSRHGRGFGRSHGSGRLPGRGRRPFGGQEERHKRPVVTPGRRLFPGRGFRPGGPSKSFDADAEFVSWKSERDQTDVDLSRSTGKIQFGEFDISVTGNFDPFSNQSPAFQNLEWNEEKSDRSRDVDAGAEVHRVDVPFRSGRRHGPLDMSLVGAVLDEVVDGRREKTPASDFGSDRGNFVRRSPQIDRGYRPRGGRRFDRGGRSYGRGGDHYSPFTDGSFEYDAFDSGSYGRGGRHPDWNRRHSDDGSSFRGRRGWRNDRGGRRGRGRDVGRYSRHQGDMPSRQYRPRMQWVPKKSPPDEDKNET